MSGPRSALGRGFRRLWIGDAISMFGDWFTYVAVGTLALAEGTGLIAVAIVLLAHTIPRAVIAPWAGRLADRVDRRAIMVVASLLRALAVVGMIVGARQGSLWLVQALLVLRMAFGALIEPAASAAIPQLVGREQLERANTILSVTWSVIFAAGVAVGGVATAALGPVVALAIDAATFVIAAGILATLPRLEPVIEDLSEVAGDTPGGGGLAVALRVAWRERPILQAALAKLPVAIASGGAWILLHGVAEDPQVLPGAVAVALGWLHGARAVGTGVGPIVWTWFGLSGTSRGVHGSVLLTLAATALLIAATNSPVALAAALLLGAGGGANWVTASTLMQRLTPNHLLGRVASVDLLSHTLGQCLGGVVGALIADHMGAPAWVGWFGIAGGACAWLGLVALAAGPRGAREEEAA
ncbi:MAG: MFS transporter [Myxococcales bacterium]|nr:MFS transporter [Myxococcales bacterium]